jgi:hypothetical protein
MGETNTEGPSRAGDDSLFPSRSLDVDQDLTLERIERSMPVRLIATLDNLITAIPDEPLTDALDEVNKNRFLGGLAAGGAYHANDFIMERR